MYFLKSTSGLSVKSTPSNFASTITRFAFSLSSVSAFNGRPTRRQSAASLPMLNQAKKSRAFLGFASAAKEICANEHSNRSKWSLFIITKLQVLTSWMQTTLACLHSLLLGKGLVDSSIWSLVISFNPSRSIPDTLCPTAWIKRLMSLCLKQRLASTGSV